MAKKAGEKTASKTKSGAGVKKAAKAVGKVAKKSKKSSEGQDSSVPTIDPRWQEYREQHANGKSSSYKMTGSFEANQGLQHPKLGWGYILSVQNDRLEVLFENGPRILISNYKG